MYCKNCGIEIPDDSKFCYKCGVSVTTETKQNQIDNGEAKKTKSKKSLEFYDELMELNQLIQSYSNSLFSASSDKNIVDLLSKTTDNKVENAELIILNYKKKFKVGLIDELKSLSNNYLEIKDRLKPFIELGIIEKEYPHKLITLSDELAASNPLEAKPKKNVTASSPLISGSGCLKVIGIFIGISVLIALFMPDTEPIETVSNSAYDASVHQVERYLKREYLKDPDSYQGIEWSEVQTSESNPRYKYYVRHKFRAKNSFGGYAVENKIFYLDSEGNVVDHKDTDLP